MSLPNSVSKKWNFIVILIKQSISNLSGVVLQISFLTTCNWMVFAAFTNKWSNLQIYRHKCKVSFNIRLKVVCVFSSFHVGKIFPTSIFCCNFPNERVCGECYFRVSNHLFPVSVASPDVIGLQNCCWLHGRFEPADLWVGAAACRFIDAGKTGCVDSVRNHVSVFPLCR
jgi:hypothetical protein